MYRVYYSTKEDLATGPYLDLAEKRIHEIEEHGFPTDLDGIIELWHIYRLFADDCRLKRWNEEYFDQLKSKCISYNKEVATYFKNLESDSIETKYNSLELGYKESFWKIVSQFKCFNIIKSDFLINALDDENNLRFVLSNKAIVERFKVVLHNALLKNKNTVYILLDKYVRRKSNSDEDKIFLPENLTIEEKEDIILDYLYSEDPNINYVRLICQSKDITGEFKLQPKTRYKAKKIEKKLNDEIISNPDAIITESKFGILFSNEDNINVVSYSDENGYPVYKYSIKHILDCTSEQKIRFFEDKFEWFTSDKLINLVNKNNEVDVIEMTLTDKGQYSYPDFSSFKFKESFSFQQLLGYCNILNKYDISFENELKTFYEQILYDRFGYSGLKILLPKIDGDWVGKCRTIFPLLDGISRQYYAFVTEGEIDAEYISFIKNIKVGNVKSLLKCKYINVNKENNYIINIIESLFRCSFICNIDPFKKKRYKSLAKLIENEVVYYSYYEKHLKPYIDFLIDKEVLFVDSEGVLHFKNRYLIDILKSLWEFNCYSYWHLDEKGRKVADDMIQKGWVIVDDHLLSKEERDYFSFYVDNERFTNGSAYRNQYAHGSEPPTEDIEYHITAYYVLLKLLTLLILKIYDDLWLARKVMMIDLRNKNINK